MKQPLRSWLWRVSVDQEIEEELALHVEMRVRELVEQGMDRQAARELALTRRGDVARLKRELAVLGRKRDRGMRIALWTEELFDDLRFAVRQLKAAPSFTQIGRASCRERGWMSVV